MDTVFIYKLESMSRVRYMCELGRRVASAWQSWTKYCLEAFSDRLCRCLHFRSILQTRISKSGPRFGVFSEFLKSAWKVIPNVSITLYSSHDSILPRRIRFQTCQCKPRGSLIGTDFFFFLFIGRLPKSNSGEFHPFTGDDRPRHLTIGWV